MTMTAPMLPASEIIAVLSGEFGRLPRDVVERCVSDVSACVAHLGRDADPVLVERIAREHLVGILMSEPPSGRLKPTPN